MAAQRSQPRATVLGLEVWEACSLALFLGPAARLARSGVHEAWDVIVAVSGVILLAWLGWMVWSRMTGRLPYTRHVGPSRQDWLWTAVVGAMIALFVLPDAPAPVVALPILIVLVGGTVLVVVRGWRRARTKPATQAPP